MGRGMVRAGGGLGRYILAQAGGVDYAVDRSCGIVRVGFRKHKDTAYTDQYAR